MGTGQSLNASITAPDERKLRWLQTAFKVQMVMLALLIGLMIFVSVQFSAKQRMLIASNVKMAGLLFKQGRTTQPEGR